LTLEKQVELKLKIIEAGQKYQFVNNQQKAVIDRMNLDNQEKRLELVKKILKLSDKFDSHGKHQQVFQKLFDDALKLDTDVVENEINSTATEFLLGDNSSSNSYDFNDTVD